MATVPSIYWVTPKPFYSSSPSSIENPRSQILNKPLPHRRLATLVPPLKRRRSTVILNAIDKDSDQKNVQDEEVESLGVKAALSMLNFYKREISPIMPKSCRYVPSCSEYSMEAYKKYGVAKGTVLTAWRLCRCNPLGGSGFDPPRWFDEKKPISEE